MTRRRTLTRGLAVSAVAALLVAGLAAPALAAQPSQAGGRGRARMQQGQGQGQGQGGTPASVAGAAAGDQGANGQAGQGAPVGRDEGFKTVADTILAHVARLDARTSRVAARGIDVSGVTTLLDSARAKVAQSLADEALAFQASSAARALPRGPERRAAIQSAQGPWKTAREGLKAARSDVQAAISALRALVKSAVPSTGDTNTVAPAPGNGGATPSGDTSGTPGGGVGTTGTAGAALGTTGTGADAGPVGALQALAANVWSLLRGLLGAR